MIDFIEIIANPENHVCVQPIHLMEAVAEEAQRKAAIARAELMVQLRAEIAAVDARQGVS